ncbi:MAG: PQQ-like beta-propeller repeat protein [Limisphaerales bacterium]
MNPKPLASTLTGLVLATLLNSSALAATGDWPQWRGPNRDGISTETGLLKDWPAGGPPLVWKTTGLGAGFATVALVGDRIYTSGDIGSENFVIALNRADGQKVWSTKLGKAGAPGWGGFAGVRGTPTVTGDHLYAIGQYGEIACFEAASGKEVWRKHFVDDFGGKLPEWGFSESALVDGDQVVATPGGPQGALVALDRKTGKLLWQSKDFTDEAHYSSIIQATIAGVPQYIQLTAASVVGISPKDGKVLWRANRKGATAVIPTPIYHDNHVYVTSGYGIGCNLFKISESGGTFSTEQVYANKVIKNHHGGVILLDGKVYGNGDPLWVCQDLKTGKADWDTRAVGKGAIAYADGRFYLREEKKKGSNLVLIEATPTAYSEKGRFEQPDQSGKDAWAHPVIAGGMLYVRDQDVLLCYDVRAK